MKLENHKFEQYISKILEKTAYVCLTCGVLTFGYTMYQNSIFPFSRMYNLFKSHPELELYRQKKLELSKLEFFSPNMSHPGKQSLESELEKLSTIYPHLPEKFEELKEINNKDLETLFLMLGFFSVGTICSVYSEKILKKMEENKNE